MNSICGEAVFLKTYLQIIFNSEGALPSEVKNSLLNLGFRATKGNYDFVYDWSEEDVKLNDLIFFADRVHAALLNCNVYFRIETL